MYSILRDLHSKFGLEMDTPPPLSQEVDKFITWLGPAFHKGSVIIDRGLDVRDRPEDILALLLARRSGT